MGDKESSYENVGDGIKDVTTAGTRVQLSTSSVACRMVQVQARPENTGVVVVGSSGVVASASTRRGIALVPGASVALRVTDLNKLYLDSAVSAEGVSYVYFW
jgi:hypothetical protein